MRTRTSPFLLEQLEDRRLRSGNPTISVGDASLPEGDAGTQNAVLVVSLNAASRQTVSVNYATANGTAVSGSDYTATSDKLTFAPGETRKSILVPVKGDALLEGYEKFFVNLGSASHAKVTEGQGVVTIVDDDDHRPQLSINNVWAWDAASGSTLYTFTVSLSAAVGDPVTVNYATADGTATAADGDYLAASGTLTFAPGETTKTLTVEVIGNATNPIVNGSTGFDEWFYVNLSNASGNALVSAAQGVGTIHYFDRVTSPGDPGSDEYLPWG
jgi:hypothetical protein